MKITIEHLGSKVSFEKEVDALGEGITMTLELLMVLGLKLPDEIPSNLGIIGTLDGSVN